MITIAHNIERTTNTILFIGYQANGTLGRTILEKPEEVRILGRYQKVRARIEKINGFSAHADRNELLEWINGLQNPPKLTCVTHGEPESSLFFAETLKQKKGWNITVPKYLEKIPLWVDK
jgi:metallo-beta-lactamase family protein